MARLDQQHPDDVPGDWFADTRCIGCDVARHYAPGLIGADDEGLSVIVRQPETAEEEAAMWRATVACPTQSIGTISRRRPPADVFPWRLTDEVFLCGHNDEASFGAHSYFALRPEGNLLVDSPRWTRRLVERFEAMGGIAHVLLTHRDDVVDADRYAEHFGARVWIHEDDAQAAPYASDLLRGGATTEIAPGVRAIAIPGHTEGSAAFVDDAGHLFAGDSLWWNEQRDGPDVYGSVTWYSWDALAASIAHLADEASFSWVLPGHGKWGSTDPATMDTKLRAMAAEMTQHTKQTWGHR